MPFWKKIDKGGKKKPPKPAVPRTAQQSIRCMGMDCWAVRGTADFGGFFLPPLSVFFQNGIG